MSGRGGPDVGQFGVKSCFQASDVGGSSFSLGSLTRGPPGETKQNFNPKSGGCKSFLLLTESAAGPLLRPVELSVCFRVRGGVGLAARPGLWHADLGSVGRF